MAHSEFLQWSPLDRSKAVAFFYEKSARCALCGTAEWEWAEDKDAYQAISEFCPGCYRKDAAQDGSDHLPGQSVTLVPTTSATWQAALAKEEADYHARLMRAKEDADG
jgi:hypothetical protein